MTAHYTTHTRVSFFHTTLKKIRAYSVVSWEELEQEAGDDAGDSYEEVGHDENDVSRARLVKHEGGGVHHGRDRPPVKQTILQIFDNTTTITARAN